MSEHPRCKRDGGLLLMERGVYGLPDRVFCPLCGWSVEREVVPVIPMVKEFLAGNQQVLSRNCTVVGCTCRINWANQSGLCQKHGNQMQMFERGKTKTPPLLKVGEVYLVNPEYGQAPKKGRRAA